MEMATARVPWSERQFEHTIAAFCNIATCNSPSEVWFPCLLTLCCALNCQFVYPPSNLFGSRLSLILLILFADWLVFWGRQNHSGLKFA